jgi:hypothetical protein
MGIEQLSRKWVGLGLGMTLNRDPPGSQDRTYKLIFHR